MNDLDTLKDQVVLITGGAGSLGNALTRRIIDVARKVIVFSRDEAKHAEMLLKFHDHSNLRFFVGDIRDAGRITTALRGVDVCIHAACMKRVESCTYNPIEAAKNNVLGSINVLEACVQQGVRRVLYISTDKASSPITLYGGTKFVSEQLFINGNNYAARGETVLFASRYGNVYASRGSIRHLFERQLKEKGIIELTDEHMTRFFMSMDQAVDLNLYALSHALGGEIFVPKLKAACIVDFAHTFFPGAPTKVIGLRGYEKLHEELITPSEASSVVDCGCCYKILPAHVSNDAVGWDLNRPSEPLMAPFKYSSDCVERFTEEELRAFEGAVK